MIVTPVHRGAPVEAVGTVVHTPAGPLLIADPHWDASLLALPTLGPDSPFIVPLGGRCDVAQGEHVTATGAWTGRGIVVRTVVRHDVPPPPVPRRAGPVRPRPVTAPGPPGELERTLLADGTITSRLPYGDGTLHVVADDLDRVREALGPVYGHRLRVHRAVFSQQQRRVADAALDVADDLDVVCGVGSTSLDDTRLAETVHILEVGWVPEALADALAAVPTGLVQLTTHVRVIRAG